MDADFHPFPLILNPFSSGAIFGFLEKKLNVECNKILKILWNPYRDALKLKKFLSAPSGRQTQHELKLDAVLLLFPIFFNFFKNLIFHFYFSETKGIEHEEFLSSLSMVINKTEEPDRRKFEKEVGLQNKQIRHSESFLALITLSDFEIPCQNHFYLSSWPCSLHITTPVHYQH